MLNNLFLTLYIMNMFSYHYHSKSSFCNISEIGVCPTIDAI